MSKKVLIVDDEPLIRSSLERIFARKGYSVLTAENGVVGLKIWLNEKPDIICLDYLMPGLNGLELLNEIPEKLKSCIVVMSAYVGALEREDFIKKGAKNFYNKPFDDIFKFVDEVERISHVR